MDNKKHQTYTIYQLISANSLIENSKYLL
jgi:hypothetical protein